MSLEIKIPMVLLWIPSKNYLVIKGENSNVLELPAPDPSSLMFSKNGLKDSQFWYLSNQPNSDYGYIGSKKHIGKVLTISLGDSLKDNGKGWMFTVSPLYTPWFALKL